MCTIYSVQDVLDPSRLSIFFSSLHCWRTRTGLGMKSKALGMIDGAYNAYRRAVTPAEQRWYRKGYGDIITQQAQSDTIVAAFGKDGMEEWLSKTPFSLTSAPWAPTGEIPPQDVLRDELSFASPMADQLPRASAVVRALFVRAAPGSNLYPPTRCIMLHMAPTGVTAYSDREKLAYPLLEYGIASIIIIPPFSGSRAPPAQPAHYIETVADYMRQSQALIAESVQLLRGLARSTAALPPFSGDERKLDDGRPASGAALVSFGVIGLSWGGSMSACVALASELPVACVVGLGSDSPKVMATGAIRCARASVLPRARGKPLSRRFSCGLRSTSPPARHHSHSRPLPRARSWQLDWKALMDEGGNTREETEDQIVQVFTRVKFATLLERRPAPTIGVCVQVQAVDDKYVAASEGAQLHESLRKAVPHGRLCEMRWIPGGHGSAFVQVKQRHLFVHTRVHPHSPLTTHPLSASPVGSRHRSYRR